VPAGLFVEAAGIRIVRPWRLHALSIDWSDVARFEMQTGAGRWPVSLIRLSDQRRIPIPTYSPSRCRERGRGRDGDAFDAFSDSCQLHGVCGEFD
jgi:hypothetical protein